MLNLTILVIAILLLYGVYLFYILFKGEDL